ACGVSGKRASVWAAASANQSDDEEPSAAVTIRKARSPLTASSRMLALPGPGTISPTGAVPAGVPSLDHSSQPSSAVQPEKKRRCPLMELGGNHLGGLGTLCGSLRLPVTGKVPCGVPSVRQIRTLKVS